MAIKEETVLMVLPVKMIKSYLLLKINKFSLVL